MYNVRGATILYTYCSTQRPGHLRVPLKQGNQISYDGRPGHSQRRKGRCTFLDFSIPFYTNTN